MEGWRKAALCHVLVALLIVASSEVWCVQGQDQECWREDDGNHHMFCVTDEPCKRTCLEHGNKDGRCMWSNVWRVCECLPETC
ncbi:hypothetical protein ACP70R_036508 [Stipagrostis hirtigluma subsp. patula]